MRMRGTCASVLLLCSVLPASASGAESVSVHSPSRRFLVTGLDGGQAISVSRWADDVSVKLERATRSRMSFRNREFRIRVSAGSDLPAGRVGFNERFSEGKFLQELVVENPGAADWEDVLEVYCTLLLNGQTAAVGAGGAVGRWRSTEKVPAWLAVGLAHCIDPVLKSRDRRIVLEWRKSGKVPPFAEILKWHVLPPGRSREKAACTMAVAWLLSLPDAASRFRLIQERLAANEVLTCEWMVAQIPGSLSVEQAENLWTKRIENERQVISDPGVLFPDALESLKDQLVIRRGEYGVPADTNLPAVIELKTLVGMKKSEWIPTFCRAKSVGIKMASVHGSAEVREVGDAYCGFMSLLGEGGRDSRLLSLLARADDTLRRLETTMREREAYMDEMERTHLGTNAVRSSGRNVSRDKLDRSRLQKYIDEVEQHQEGQQAESAGATGDTGVGSR